MRVDVTKIILFNNKNKSIFETLTLARFLESKQNYLAIMHLHKLWLECHCVKGTAVAFVKRNSLNYSLVNHAVLGQHDKQCKLHTQISGEILTGEQVPKASISPPTHFTVLKINESDSESQEKCTGRKLKHNNKKSDRIHSLLSFALEEKYLNVLRINKGLNMNAIFFSKMFQLLVTKNNGHSIKVADITYVLPNKKARDYQLNVMRMKYKFANEVPLQCNFIFFVDDVSINETTNTFSYTQDLEIKTVETIRQIHHYPQTTGPRIIFITKALINEQWQNYLAYSHPIISIQHPVLIDSSLERNFANLFLQMSKEGATLTKPYTSKEYKGHHLLPDFIYKSGDRFTCIVEVMGMLNQEDYKLRKEKLVPMMRARFNMDVIEVEPGNIESRARELFCHLDEKY